MTKKTPQYIFDACQKYLNNYTIADVPKHFTISKNQFLNLYQQMDTGAPYVDFHSMYLDYSHAHATNHRIKISKKKYIHTILLLISYYKNILIFSV